MDTTLSIALSHQVARRRQMDVIANNIANMSTTAFKRENVMFGQYIQKGQGTAPNSIKQIAYVQDFGISRNLANGPLDITGNPFDVALNGDGMFQVRQEDGQLAYSRNGHMGLSDDYTLVTASGQEVLDDGGQPIQIPPNMTDVKIASDGTVSSQLGPIAKLNVVTFDDVSKLRKIGDNLFSAATPAIPATDFKIVQGATELSNVQPIIEITRMIEISRSYIQTSKIVENLQDAKKRALTQLAKVG